ncbi:MAG: hypothetical protein ACK5LC_07065 [Coprobacillaceae bacterium]
MSKRILLLSLQEEPYLDILNGNKKYEYRTRYARCETIAFVYISRTYKEIVAIIEFGIPIYKRAEELIKIETTIKKQKELQKWLNGRDGYAIPVQQIKTCSPINLATIKEHFPDFTIPQSYLYLDTKPEFLNYLIKETGCNINIR